MITLWALILLSILGLYLSAGIRQKISLVKKLTFRDNLYFIADSGVKQAIIELKKDETLQDSLKENWSDNPAVFKDRKVGLGKFNVYYNFFNQDGKKEERFGMVDEERKININKAKRLVIKRLIEEVAGLDETEAQQIASSIIDWRDSDSFLSIPTGSGEDSYYQNLREPYDCKDSEFQVLRELLLVRGMDEEIFSKIKDFITIYGDGSININTAYREVLLALGIDDILVDKIISFRVGDDGVEATSDDNVFDSPSNIVAKLSQFVSLSADEVTTLSNLVSKGTFTTSSYNFMIKSEACIPPANLKKQIICIVNKEGQILSWQEL